MLGIGALGGWKFSVLAIGVLGGLPPRMAFNSLRGSLGVYQEGPKGEHGPPLGVTVTGQQTLQRIRTLNFSPETLNPQILSLPKLPMQSMGEILGLSQDCT